MKNPARSPSVVHSISETARNTAEACDFFIWLLIEVHAVSGCMIKCITDLKQKEMFMADQKIDNLLNLAMDATPEERRKCYIYAVFIFG